MCEELLKDLMHHEDSWPFIEPVDISEVRCIHELCIIHRLDASCGFYGPFASLSSTCIKLVSFIQLQQVCENLTCCKCLQTCCKLLKQLASALWIKSLDNHLASSLLTTCSRLVIIKLEQAQGRR